jgi:general L-amino acid transport system permease protein
VSSDVRTLEYRPPPGEEPAGPPVREVSALDWVRHNLFNTWYNSLLTLVLLPVISWLLYRVAEFVFFTGRWEIVEVNLTTFMVGLFPRGQLWRIWLAVAILGVVVGLGLGVTSRATLIAAEAKGVAVDQSKLTMLRRAAPALTLLAVMAVFVRTATPLVLIVVVAALGAGGYLVGRRLPPAGRRWANLVVILGLVAAYVVMTRFGGVPVRAWGGFLLTAFFTVAGIALSFPLGVLLALGRRSTFPAVRVICVGYIEFFRGSPLVALLFMGWLLIGFFLPAGTPTPDRVWRALVVFILFTAAYVAEIVRGGLQSVPEGQREAAVAVGLPPWKVTRLIVLPQALRNVIPAMVGQFISLYKDTSLVYIIGVLELLRVARAVTQQPGFLGQGLHAETLLFVSFIYWVGSYWMSRESQRLERRLGVGER